MATQKKEVKTKYYKLEKALATTDKCPPQARLIISTIDSVGGRISREDLISLLKRSPEEGGLKTNQTPERIFGFYRPKLMELGVMSEETEVSTIEIEVPDAPAKSSDSAQAEEGAESASEGSGSEAPQKGVKGRKGSQKSAA